MTDNDIQTLYQMWNFSPVAAAHTVYRGLKDEASFRSASWSAFERTWRANPLAAYGMLSHGERELFIRRVRRGAAQIPVRDVEREAAITDAGNVEGS